MYQHFKTLAAHSSLPLILYNVPGRVGVNMTPDTVIRLAQTCGNIIRIKEASGFPQQASQVMSDIRTLSSYQEMIASRCHLSRMELRVSSLC